MSTETIAINWPHKSPGYYVARYNASGELTGYLTPQGGFSMRVGQATMFETAEAAQLAGALRSHRCKVLANQVALLVNTGGVNSVL